MIENYVYKKESNIDCFWYEDKKIQLRKYQKDLLFYWSGEEDKAEYALYDKSPDFEVAPSIYSGGKFGSYSKISSPLTFNGKNLESLSDNIHISFFLPILLHNSNKSRILASLLHKIVFILSIQDVTHCSYIEKTSYTLTSRFSSLFSAK